MVILLIRRRKQQKRFARKKRRLAQAEKDQEKEFDIERRLGDAQKVFGCTNKPELIVCLLKKCFPLTFSLFSCFFFSFSFLFLLFFILFFPFFLFRFGRCVSDPRDLFLLVFLYLQALQNSP